MKYVTEYILANPSSEVCHALAKADRNPCLVERMVDVYRRCGYRLKEDENPYAEQNKTLQITDKDARILTDYYRFRDKKEKAEMIAYKKAHPYPGCFYDGIELMLPDEAC